MQENLEDLLTYQQAADELGILLGSLKQAINRGSLHPIKLPRERRKFLKREDLHRYKSGKREYETPQAEPLSSATEQSPSPTAEPAPSRGPRSFGAEQMRLLFFAAGIGWSSNSIAMQKTVEAMQKTAETLQKTAEAVQRATSDNAASIRDTVVAALQHYSPASQDTTAPEGKSSSSRSQGDAEEQANTFILEQLYEMLLRTGASSLLTEQTLQEIRHLFDQPISAGSRAFPPSGQETARTT